MADDVMRLDGLLNSLQLQPTLNDAWAWACHCIGPRNGEPLCRCRMRNVKVENGRYIEVIDHGPARSSVGTNVG